MRSQKIGAETTGTSDLLVGIVKFHVILESFSWYRRTRNNKGEFDGNFEGKAGTTHIFQEFHNRDVYELNQSDYLNLAKIVVAKNSEENSESGLGTII